MIMFWVTFYIRPFESKLESELNVQAKVRPFILQCLNNLGKHNYWFLLSALKDLKCLHFSAGYNFMLFVYIMVQKIVKKLDSMTLVPRSIIVFSAFKMRPCCEDLIIRFVVVENDNCIYYSLFTNMVWFNLSRKSK